MDFLRRCLTSSFFSTLLLPLCCVGDPYSRVTHGRDVREPSTSTHTDWFSNTNDWLKEKTWIIWYKRNPSGITHLVWDPEVNESFPFEDMTYRGYRERCPFDFERKISQYLNVARTAPTQDLSLRCDVPDYPLLQFWTLATFYTVECIDVFWAVAYLADRNCDICGSVWLDGFEESTFSSHLVHLKLSSYPSPMMSTLPRV